MFVLQHYTWRSPQKSTYIAISQNRECTITVSYFFGSFYEGWKNPHYPVDNAIWLSYNLAPEGQLKSELLKFVSSRLYIALRTFSAVTPASKLE